MADAVTRLQLVVALERARWRFGACVVAGAASRGELERWRFDALVGALLGRTDVERMRHSAGMLGYREAGDAYGDELRQVMAAARALRELLDAGPLDDVAIFSVAPYSARNNGVAS